MDKYNKHRFFTALVLEIRASLYLTPSDAIFVMQLSLEPPPPPTRTPGDVGTLLRDTFSVKPQPNEDKLPHPGGGGKGSSVSLSPIISYLER